MGDDGNFPIKITGDASSLVTASQQAVQGLEATAKSAGKAADETQRYQKALEAMAVRQSEGKTKAVSSEDQAMIDKAGSRRQELADRKRMSAEADAEIAAGVKNVSQAEVDFATAAVAGTDKVTVKKAELKHAIQGLKEAFPGLAHIAHMALNPITLVVAGVGAAFAILKYRVDEAVKAMAGAVLPDISPAKVGQVTAMAEAWKTYKDALEGVVKGYNSVSAAAERSIKILEAEAAQQKKLMEAKKALEAATLEAARASMSPAEYEKRRLELEARSASAAMSAEEQAKRKTIAARQQEAQALREDAAKKLATAGGIKVGTAEQDARTEEDLKARAEAAKKDIDARKEWIGKIQKFQSNEENPFVNVGVGFQMMGRYGYMATTPEGSEKAIGQERGVIGSEQVNIDRYNSFLRNKSAREAARKRRGGLVTEAGTQEGQASVLDAQAADDSAALDRESGTNRQAAGMGQAAQVASALGKANDQAKDLMTQMLKLAESGHGINAELLRRVKEVQALQAELQRELAQLRGSPPRTQ